MQGRDSQREKIERKIYFDVDLEKGKSIRVLDIKGKIEVGINLALFYIYSEKGVKLETIPSEYRDITDLLEEDILPNWDIDGKRVGFVSSALEKKMGSNVEDIMRNLYRLPKRGPSALPKGRGKVRLLLSQRLHRVWNSADKNKISPEDFKGVTDKISKSLARIMSEESLKDEALVMALGTHILSEVNLMIERGLTIRQIISVISKLSSADIDYMLKTFSRTIASRAFVAPNPIETADRYLYNYHKVVAHLKGRVGEEIARTIASKAFRAKDPIETTNKYIDNYRKVVAHLKSKGGVYALIARVIASLSFDAKDPIKTAESNTIYYLQKIRIEYAIPIDKNFPGSEEALHHLVPDLRGVEPLEQSIEEEQGKLIQRAIQALIPEEQKIIEEYLKQEKWEPTPEQGRVIKKLKIKLEQTERDKPKGKGNSPIATPKKDISSSPLIEINYSANPYIILSNLLLWLDLSLFLVMLSLGYFQPGFIYSPFARLHLEASVFTNLTLAFLWLGLVGGLVRRGIKRKIKISESGREKFPFLERKSKTVSSVREPRRLLLKLTSSPIQKGDFPAKEGAGDIKELRKKRDGRWNDYSQMRIKDKRIKRIDTFFQKIFSALDDVLGSVEAIVTGFPGVTSADDYFALSKIYIEMGRYREASLQFEKVAERIVVGAATSPVGSFLDKRWKALCDSLGFQGDRDKIFRLISGLYAQEGRYYHTLEHIESMLREFDEVKAMAQDSLAIELAIWLHDVIYNPRRRDNEEQSAEFAGKICEKMQLFSEFMKKVKRLILLTKTHNISEGDINGAILVDLDLTSLGRSPEIYDAYRANVEQEYGWIPKVLYKQWRIGILRRFLSKESLYNLPYFKERYEQQARANLEREIKFLESSELWSCLEAGLARGLVLPKACPEPYPQVLKGKRQAVYPGYFAEFSDRQKDIIAKSLKLFDRLLVLALPQDKYEEKISNIQERVDKIYGRVKDIGGVLVLGLVDRELMPFLLEALEIRHIIRKVHRLHPQEGQLKHEAEIAKKNYQQYGLETIFVLPDNQYLEVEDTLLEAYERDLGDLLKKEGIVIPPEVYIGSSKFKRFINEYNQKRKAPRGKIDTKIAIYPGSFYPVTSGHVEVIKRLSQIFHKVYLVVGYNPNKTYLLSPEERKEILEEAIREERLENVFVKSWPGLMVDSARNLGAGVLVRGARSIKDLKFELPYAYATQLLDPEIAVMLLTPYHYENISSSYFRETLREEGRIIDEVPLAVKKIFESPGYYWRFLKEKILELKQQADTKLIGLAGGIGTGKSTVLAIMKEKDAYYIRFDDIGKKVRDGEEKNEVVMAFGRDILDTSGKIDPRKLGDIVFANKDKLDLLNQILFPEMNRKAYLEILQALERKYKYIVIEGAVLFETGIQQILDEVWGIVADENIIYGRLREKYSQEKIRKIREKQLTDDELRKLATRIINNSGSESELKAHIDGILAEIEKKASSPLFKKGIFTLTGDKNTTITACVDALKSGLGSLRDKEVMVEVSASEKAYQSVYLVSRLVKEGARVRVLLKKKTEEYVKELTLRAISRNEVLPYVSAKKSWLVDKLTKFVSMFLDVLEKRGIPTIKMRFWLSKLGLLANTYEVLPKRTKVLLKEIDAQVILTGKERLLSGLEPEVKKLMPIFRGKKIIIGITGGIAAYKAIELVERLKEAGAEVKVAITPNALTFIGMQTFKDMGIEAVYDEFAPGEEWQARHISWAKWAEMIILAPATANTIAKISQGIADNFLTTLLLSAKAPVLITPAMEKDMHENQRTQENIKRLKERRDRNYFFAGPEKGLLASGEIGIGRMSEVAQILERAALVSSSQAPSFVEGMRQVLNDNGQEQKTTVTSENSAWRNSAVIILLRKEEGRYSVLLAQRSQSMKYGGQWVFPGGHSKEVEPLLETGIRELLEETGIKIETKVVLGALPTALTEDQLNLIHPFVAFAPEGFQYRRSRESKDEEWLSLEELFKKEIIIERKGKKIILEPGRATARIIENFKQVIAQALSLEIYGKELLALNREAHTEILNVLKHKPEFLSEMIGYLETEKDLKGLTIIVTAGPNREMIPGRQEYITNLSTGKQGFEVARVASRRGAKVILITGPSVLETPLGVERIDVVSAVEMKDAVMKNISKADVYISTAAIADFRPERIEKKDGLFIVDLARNPDILREVGLLKRERFPELFVIGFAAETMKKKKMIEEAKGKLVRKNLDMICGNVVTEEGSGFAGETNKVVFITQETAESFAGTKFAVGNNILNKFLQLSGKRTFSYLNHPDRVELSAEIIKRMKELKSPQQECAPPITGLAYRKIIITAGVTQEPIDPIRFVSRQAEVNLPFAVAQLARQNKAEVILISGPVPYSSPKGITHIIVRTAEEMNRLLKENLKDADILIHLAEVPGIKPLEIASEKIKKAGKEQMQWRFVPNIEILPDTIREEPFLAVVEREKLEGLAGNTSDIAYEILVSARDNPKPYLKATKLTDSNNPHLSKEAKEIAQGIGDQVEIVSKIVSSIRRKIFYHFDSHSIRASETHRKGFGMCANMTNYAVALCRALGIPARFNMVFFKKAYIQHTVLQAFYPRMKPITRHCRKEVYVDGVWQAVDVDEPIAGWAVIKSMPKEIYGSMDEIVRARNEAKAKGLGSDKAFLYLNRIFRERLENGQMPEFLPPRTKIIGVAGFIGSGKTTAVAIVEVIGLTSVSVVNLEEIKHKVLKEAKTKDKITKIIFPRIKQLAVKRINEAKEQGKKYIVIEGTIIGEIGLDKICDAIWIIETNENKRQRRLMSLRNDLDEKKIMAILRAEKPLVSFLKQNPKVKVIKNNEDIKAMVNKVREALRQTCLSSSALVIKVDFDETMVEVVTALPLAKKFAKREGYNINNIEDYEQRARAYNKNPAKENLIKEHEFFRGMSEGYLLGAAQELKLNPQFLEVLGMIKKILKIKDLEIVIVSAGLKNIIRPFLDRKEIKEGLKKEGIDIKGIIANELVIEGGRVPLEGSIHQGKIITSPRKADYIGNELYLGDASDEKHLSDIIPYFINIYWPDKEIERVINDKDKIEKIKLKLKNEIIPFRRKRAQIGLHLHSEYYGYRYVIWRALERNFQVIAITDPNRLAPSEAFSEIAMINRAIREYNLEHKTKIARVFLISAIEITFLYPFKKKEREAYLIVYLPKGFRPKTKETQDFLNKLEEYEEEKARLLEQFHQEFRQEYPDLTLDEDYLKAISRYRPILSIVAQKLWRRYCQELKAKGINGPAEVWEKLNLPALKGWSKKFSELKTKLPKLSEVVSFVKKNQGKIALPWHYSFKPQSLKKRLRLLEEILMALTKEVKQGNLPPGSLLGFICYTPQIMNEKYFELRKGLDGLIEQLNKDFLEGYPLLRLPESGELGMGKGEEEERILNSLLQGQQPGRDSTASPVGIRIYLFPGNEGNNFSAVAKYYYKAFKDIFSTQKIKTYAEPGRKTNSSIKGDIPNGDRESMKIDRYHISMPEIYNSRACAFPDTYKLSDGSRISLKDKKKALIMMLVKKGIIYPDLSADQEYGFDPVSGILYFLDFSFTMFMENGECLEGAFDSFLSNVNQEISVPYEELKLLWATEQNKCYPVLDVTLEIEEAVNLPKENGSSPLGDGGASSSVTGPDFLGRKADIASSGNKELRLSDFAFSFERFGRDAKIWKCPNFIRLWLQTFRNLCMSERAVIEARSIFLAYKNLQPEKQSWQTRFPLTVYEDKKCRAAGKNVFAEFVRLAQNEGLTICNFSPEPDSREETFSLMPKYMVFNNYFPNFYLLFASNPGIDIEAIDELPAIYDPCNAYYCLDSMHNELSTYAKNITFEELLERKVRLYCEVYNEIKGFAGTIDTYLMDKKFITEHPEKMIANYMLLALWRDNKKLKKMIQRDYKKFYFLPNHEAYRQVKKAFIHYEKFFAPRKAGMGKLREEINLSLKAVLSNNTKVSSPLGEKYILVAEDSKRMRGRYRKALKGWGYNVMTVKNKKRAGKLFRQQYFKFDLIAEPSINNGYTGSPNFVPYARRDDDGVPSVVRRGGATPQTGKRRASPSLYSWGWPLLGCDCVSRPWRSARLRLRPRSLSRSKIGSALNFLKLKEVLIRHFKIKPSVNGKGSVSPLEIVGCCVRTGMTSSELGNYPVFQNSSVLNIWFTEQSLRSDYCGLPVFKRQKVKALNGTRALCRGPPKTDGVLRN